MGWLRNNAEPLFEASARPRPALVLSGRAAWGRRLAALAGRALLGGVASVSLLAVLFIFVFVGRDAWPFFRSRGVVEFLTSVRWYPVADPPEFGCLPMFMGTALVTLGAMAVAVPVGLAAAVGLSDILPFGARQALKPVVEILAAIPSVAYGFFALVVLAPALQRNGGRCLAAAWWAVAAPLLLLGAVVLSDVLSGWLPSARARAAARWTLGLGLAAAALWGVARVGAALAAVQLPSGTNALNVSFVLGLMALPTVVSVSEDALQAVGRELREGSYALGATRAETLCRAVIPAASSGLGAAVILGMMRAIGETMVVWMASGNAAQIPRPWYNILQPVRTLTATIAGDMGEADHVTGSDRYHVLFAMGLSLLAIAFLCNAASEAVVRRQRRRLRGA